MSIWGSTVGAALTHLLRRSGGTMTGPLDLGGNALTGVPLPTGDSHGANKQYVDRNLSKKVEKVSFTLTLPAASWAGSQPPFTQTLPLNGILESDDPYWGLLWSGSELTGQKWAFGCVDVMETKNNSVTLTCLENKPDRDLTLRLEVFR